MPTYQTLTEGLYNTAVGKSFLVKGIEYIKMNEALLMRKDTGTYYTYGIDFGKMPGFLRSLQNLFRSLRLESSNMQVSNSVLKLEEFHGYKKK